MNTLIPAAGKLQAHAQQLRDSESEVRSARHLSSLQAYWDQLTRADWSYECSDDHSAYTCGAVATGVLRAGRNQSKDHAVLFDAFEAYHSALNRWWGSRADFDATHSLPQRP